MNGCGNPAFICYREYNKGRNEFSEFYEHEIYLCDRCMNLAHLENVDKVRDWIQYDSNTDITYEYTLYIDYQFISQD